MPKEIQIAVRAAEIVPLSRLRIIQDDLKSLSKANFAKLASEIEEKGMSFAIHVWDDGNNLCILDGTQRYRVIQTQVKMGLWKIPGIPVNFVEAKSEKEAVKKLLGAAGSYGQAEEDGLYFLMIKHQISPLEIPNIELPGILLPEFTEGFFGEGMIEPEPDDGIPCPTCGKRKKGIQ